jgi:RNA polymerase sigma-70 factor (ECF subfamily)
MPLNEAAAELLLQHRESLHLYIAGKLGPDGADLAPDIWQEVAIATHCYPFETSPVKDPLNWLRQVASNKIADHWRTNRRGREADTRWMESHQEAPSKSPFDWVLRQSRREEVRGVLARLAEEDRRLLREKYLEGHTVAEIADKEGEGEKVIEHRLARARASFREMMSREI